MPQDRGEKAIGLPKIFDDRQIVRATAAALRSAIARRNTPISFGLPDTSFEGRLIETKWGLDFIKEHQFRNFSWALRWRGQHVGIETAPSRACQMNPKQFEGLRCFPDVESYLLDLEGSSTWTPRDSWGLASMWRELVRLIPREAGTKIAHLYPDLRPADEIAADTADTAAEEVEPVAADTDAAEPIAGEECAHDKCADGYRAQTLPAPVQVTPPRTDLAPEASRYLDGT